MIRTFKDVNDRRPRDLREMVTVLCAKNAPILIADEKRIDAGGKPFVFFSVVILPCIDALRALHSTAELCQQHRRAAGMSGPRLLREDADDASLLRNHLQHHLEQAWIVRAGITYESLRRWRRETGWDGVVTEQNRINIRGTEFSILQNLGTELAITLGLSGLAMMVVDRSVQNGLDPEMTRVAAGELLGVTFDVTPETHLAIIATTPEDSTCGSWIRLADLDAAMAEADPRFATFSHAVRSAPLDGHMVYWHKSFPPIRDAHIVPPDA